LDSVRIAAFIYEFCPDQSVFFLTNLDPFL
jgi:hypothetical protein